MSEVIKFPGKASAKVDAVLERVEEEYRPSPGVRQLLEEQWRKPGVANPCHLNHPVPAPDGDQLIMFEGEIVTDGGAERNRFNNFLIKIRKEPTA